MGEVWFGAMVAAASIVCLILLLSYMACWLNNPIKGNQPQWLSGTLRKKPTKVGTEYYFSLGSIACEFVIEIDPAIIYQTDLWAEFLTAEVGDRLSFYISERDRVSRPALKELWNGFLYRLQPTAQLQVTKKED